jgi:hypothetical protein
MLSALIGIVVVVLVIYCITRMLSSHEK